MSLESITITRMELYEKVWTNPMRKLAKEFGISDVGLSKLCRRHDIPLPGMGYWTRVQFGKSTKRVPLPPQKEKEKDTIVISPTEYRACEPPRNTTPKPKLTVDVAEDREIKHPFAVRTRRLFRSTSKDQRGILYPKEGIAAHMFVTVDALPRALRILDALLFAIEAQGHVLKWSEQEKERLTITTDGEAIQFAVSETIEQRTHTPTKEELARQNQSSWNRPPKWDFVATGRLCVSLEDLPYGLKTLRKSWADGKYQRLEDCLGDFIQNLPRAVLAIKLDKEDKERTRRQWAEKEKQAEEARQRHAEFQRKAKHVSRLIEEWNRSKHLLEFATLLRTSSDSQQLNDEGRNELNGMADWAERYGEALNPLARLEGVLQEFKRPPNPYGWAEP
jgi:hypothetical protein